MCHSIHPHSQIFLPYLPLFWKALRKNHFWNNLRTLYTFSVAPTIITEKIKGRAVPIPPIVKNFVPFASFWKAFRKKSLFSLVELMVTSSFLPLTTFSILKLSNWKTWGGGDVNNLAQTGFMTWRASGQRPEAGLLNKLLSRAVVCSVWRDQI